MGRGRNALAAVVVVLAVGLLAAGCGSDDEKAAKTVTDTVTETETVTAPHTETPEATEPELTATTEIAPPPESGGSDEISDLPLCSAGPPPCRDRDDNVVEPPGVGGGTGAGGGGESADLPLCSAGPPPCRTGDGKVVEP